jgi:hypothetical protein
MTSSHKSDVRPEGCNLLTSSRLWAIVLLYRDNGVAL